MKSRHLVTRRVADASEGDFEASAAWQDYLWEVYGRRPPTLLVLKVRDDAEDYTFQGGRQKNGKLVATATIPSAWLDGASAEENAEVYRRVKERFFHDMAAAAALPPPPPLPPRLPPREEKVAPGAGIAWLSERRGFRAPATAENEWFFADASWQDYLLRTQGDLFSIVYVVVDRDSTRRWHRRKANGEVLVSVDIPSQLFVGNADPELTLVEIARETFVWGMEKFGWPEPPPIPARPPGHEPPPRPINTDVR
ncbi:hypothetical protein [Nocardioides antri]|uniref:Uncharacterized protein n=1 Tax=Nocardioides antri TaxID=2607659 RepID=A0A5B1M5Y1_9ACTN|nr:hypothetical protein [Nocardioides antri]KAA1427529.1 hypothetical protein F0U47_08690 [Nocardioides antri]